MRVCQKRLWLCFVIMVPAPSALANPPPGWQPDFAAPRHPENLLVRFAAAASEEARQQVHAACQATEVKRFRHLSGLTLVKVPPAGLQAACIAYLNNPNVLYAEPDYLVFLTDIPDDPLFNKLWGLRNTGQSVDGFSGEPDADIDAPEAWNVWTGDPSFRIAVIDSGVDYLHPDLAGEAIGLGNIWVNWDEFNGTPGVDDDLNGYVDDIHGYDFAATPNDGDPRPLRIADGGSYHGTHVAGTIGAIGNNTLGVAGVCRQCKIVALRAIGGPSACGVSSVEAALEYIIDNEIRVSNNSYALSSYCQSLEQMIRQAGSQVNHVYVTSAGNFSMNNDLTPKYPCNYVASNIICVAATRSDDMLAFFSNYGATKVDLGAPGVSILSTWDPTFIPCDPVCGYSFQRGTSMATPHVAGVVALVMSQNPSWHYTQVISQVLNSVRPIPTLQGLTVTGGVVNAAAAVGNCNGNSLLDACDIACGTTGGACDLPGCGTSTDCNFNGIPDECENDCNANGIEDGCDIEAGTSNDCSPPGNGIPDECEPDCNANGIPDACDIASGTSTDDDGDGVPDSCEQTINVPTPYATIQAGLDAANEGDEVLVAPGTYSGSGNKDLDFHGKAVHLRCVVPGACTIDCQGVGRGVFFHSLETESSILDGFRIISGDQTADFSEGGGVFCLGSSPTIKRCLIQNNRAWSGGGISLLHGNPDIINCVITGNEAIADPISGKGTGGAGIACVDTVLDITETTIADNLDTPANTVAGALLVQDDCAVYISNSILWDNDTGSVGKQIHVVGSNTYILVEYSDVENGQASVLGPPPAWGLGNIDADPLFTNPLVDDYHLRLTSPCIDTGDPAFVGTGLLDIDGEARVFDLKSELPADVDMGADEFNDCNFNTVQDYLDIAAGTSPDCNANIIPDECEGTVGACCLPNGNCFEGLESCCDDQGGMFASQFCCGGCFPAVFCGPAP